MQFEQLMITRYDFRSGKLKNKGTLKVKGESGTLEINLTDQHVGKIMLAAADAIAEAAREQADALCLEADSYATPEHNPNPDTYGQDDDDELPL